MSGFTRILLFAASCIFTQNIVLVRMLGCSAFGNERRVLTAVCFGLGTTVVMTVASFLAWLAYTLVLAPLNVGFLQLTVLVMIALLSAFLVKAAAQRLWPSVAEALEDGLPYYAVCCAVLGVAVLSIEADLGLLEALGKGFFGGLGFLVAVVLMAGVQERLEFSKIPEPLKGLPISLISASLMALAFMGFAGIA